MSLSALSQNPKLVASEVAVKDVGAQDMGLVGNVEFPSLCHNARAAFVVSTQTHPVTPMLILDKLKVGQKLAQTLDADDFAHGLIALKRVFHPANIPLFAGRAT